MFDICEECHHSMSMHVGVVPMGNGHSEAVGCTHNVKTDKGVEICQCLNYDKDGEYGYE